MLQGGCAVSVISILLVTGCDWILWAQVLETCKLMWKLFLDNTKSLANAVSWSAIVDNEAHFKFCLTLWLAKDIESFDCPCLCASWACNGLIFDLTTEKTNMEKHHLNLKLYKN
jgi:hypothetical protein